MTNEGAVVGFWEICSKKIIVTLNYNIVYIINSKMSFVKVGIPSW